MYRNSAFISNVKHISTAVEMSILIIKIQYVSYKVLYPANNSW
jgi:hypothetical protein